MSSERRTIHGETPDGVADRAEGYTHNPNPEDELAIQRARFAEQQRQLQADRHQAAEAITEVSEKLGEQFAVAQHDPGHQQFIAEQQAELAAQDSATHADPATDDPTTVMLTGGEIQNPKPVVRSNNAWEEDQRRGL